MQHRGAMVNIIVGDQRLASPVSAPALLMETGDYLLLETGDYILLEE